MRRSKLGIRIALLVAAVVLAAYTATIAFIAASIQTSSREAAFSEARGLAATQAAIASTEINLVQSSVNELSHILAMYGKFPKADAGELISEMLRTTLANERRIINSWAIFLPGTIEAAAYSRIGWHRMNGSISLKDYAGEALPELLQSVLSTGDAVIAEPYSIEEISDGMKMEDAGTKLASSIAVPIIDGDGKTIGIVGADFAIAFLQARIGDTKAFQNGYGELLTNGAMIATARDPADIGKMAHELEDELGETVKDAIAAGKSFAFTSKGDKHNRPAFKYLAPVHTGAEGRPWSFLIAVPLSEVMAKVYRLVTATVLIGLVSLAALTAMITAIITRMVRPLNATVSALEEIAKGGGDLTKRIESGRRDEIGLLAEHFNRFSTSLAAMIGGIIVAADRLSRTGGELEDNMSAVSAAVTEIAANVNEMKEGASRQSKSIAAASDETVLIQDKIVRLKELVKAQSFCVAQSSASVEEMIANIASLATNAEAAGQHYAGLVQASESGTEVIAEVSRIVQAIAVQSMALSEANRTIAAIAAKTNLLAMNAAIEAAHAGDFGRGFAVVAGEIRNLAENSALQTKGIGKNIKEIQSSIASVVSSSGRAEQTFADVRGRIVSLYTLQDELKRSLIEQKQGSSATLESLAAIKDSSAEVDLAAGKMGEASTKVVSEMSSLVSAGEEFRRGVGEIAEGATEIERSVLAASELTRTNRDNIEDVSRVTRTFKTA